MLGERSLKCKCIAVVVIEEKAAIRQQVLANGDVDQLCLNALSAGWLVID